MNSIKLLGTGMFVPPLTVKNSDFTAFVETSDEWIRTRTGMSERHIAVDEPTWYLGAKAAEMAISRSGLDKNDIDMIVVSSVTPDYYTPSMACLVQRYLGIENAIAFDINVACTAFPFGFDMARRYLATGDVSNVLFISAEELSQKTDYTDRASCVLFGDGAGACVISSGEGVYGSYQNSDASGAHLLHARVPRQTHPFNSSPHTKELDMFPDIGINYMYMDGKEVYKFATKAIPKAVGLACEKAGITPQDINIFIPHQANARIIETSIKNMGLPAERFFVNIEKYGNTSSASASMALHEAIVEGGIQKGDLVCLVGFGAGLTYGSTIFEY